MLEWIDVGDVTPPRNRTLLCYCPEWNETGYQVAKWNGKEVYYAEQASDMFSETVEKWAIFFEAD